MNVRDLSSVGDFIPHNIHRNRDLRQSMRKTINFNMLVTGIRPIARSPCIGHDRAQCGRRIPVFRSPRLPISLIRSDVILVRAVCTCRPCALARSYKSTKVAMVPPSALWALSLCSQHSVSTPKARRVTRATIPRYVPYVVSFILLY